MQKIWRDSKTNNFMINRHLRYSAEISRIFIYENDGNLFEITDDFKAIKAKELYLPVFLYRFPRFTEGRCFVVIDKRKLIDDKPKYHLYIHKGQTMKIGA
jgi:hypothetical protein